MPRICLPPSLLSSLLLARLCPPSCTSLYPLWPLPPLPFPSSIHTPRYTHIDTQINWHRNIFIHTNTQSVPWSSNLHIGANIHAHVRIYFHALAHKHTHTLVMWCVVRHGVQMSGISVLALATLSTTGGLYRRKNQQSRSHEALSRSHTQTGAHTYIRTCAQAYSRTYRQHIKKAKREKKPQVLTHAHKVSKAHKNILVLTRKDNSTAGQCFQWHTHSTISQSKKENNLGKLGRKNTDKTLNYLIPS